MGHVVLASQSNLNIVPGRAEDPTSRCQANKVDFFCQKVIEDKVPNFIFKCRNRTTSTDLSSSRIWTRHCFRSPSLFFSSGRLLAFQTPDVRMTVIHCFKTVTQSHSFILTTCLEICTHCACPVQQEKWLRSFDWWRVKGQISGNCGQVVRASRDVMSRERWPSPGEDGIMHSVSRMFRKFYWTSQIYIAWWAECQLPPRRVTKGNAETTRDRGLVAISTDNCVIMIGLITIIIIIIIIIIIRAYIALVLGESFAALYMTSKSEVKSEAKDRGRVTIRDKLKTSSVGHTWNTILKKQYSQESTPLRKEKRSNTSTVRKCAQRVRSITASWKSALTPSPSRCEADNSTGRDQRRRKLRSPY